MRNTLLACLASLLLVAAGAAQTSVTVSPTTTLTAITSDNTAASSTYYPGTLDPSSNAGAGNVNRSDLHQLLNDKTIKIGARLVPFWGTYYHPDVGYDQRSYTQAVKQIKDARGRGISFLSIDWYGPPDDPSATYDDASAQALMKAAQDLSFQFVLSVDKGALDQCAKTAGCSLTQHMVRAINYLLSHYATSSMYQKTSAGTPIVWTFDPDHYGTLDWSYIRSHLSRSVKFLFRNDVGFKHSQSDGAFGWACEKTDAPTTCITNVYYQFTQTYYNKLAYGALYPGFNDKLAPWSTTKRYIDRQCGLLWLKSFDLANNYPYFASTGHRIKMLQVASWNDYEEGHEIETGIDNCVKVSSSIYSGHYLKWGIGTGYDKTTGATLNLQPTVDHFRIWVSPDGEKLMKLVDLPASARSLDLSQYKFNINPVYFVVQAVGKPSLTNKASDAVYYKAGSADTSPVSETSGVTVTITAPADGGTYTGPNVTVKAGASGATISRMSVWVDYKNVYTLWNTSSLSDWQWFSTGKHRIVVQAVDSNGNTYSSAPISITVQ